MDEAQLRPLLDLGVALGLGFLIGLERGWSLRAAAEGSRIAGLRTFSLIGFCGGLAAVLTPQAGAWLVPTALVGLAALLVVADLLRRDQDGAEPTGVASTGVAQDRGITTLVAAIVTYLLGAAAGFGRTELAVAGAVVIALLLSIKAPLHRLLQRIDRAELLAVLKLAVMTLVLLPVLPDRGFGPWDALNPYRIWWMVVLVTGLSSAGYFAIRLLGTRLGLLVTAVLGGLASSTAATVALARRAKVAPALSSLFAGAALAAGAVMAPRLLLLLVLTAPALVPRLAPPLAALTLVALAGAAVLWRRGRRDEAEVAPALGNPFELGAALKMGALLAVIMLASEALPRWLGDAGLFALAAVAGLADTDSVTLTYGGMVQQGRVAADVAAWAVLTAVGVNAVVKGGIGWVIGGPGVGPRLLAGHLASVAAAVAVMAAT